MKQILIKNVQRIKIIFVTLENDNGKKLFPVLNHFLSHEKKRKITMSLHKKLLYSILFVR